MSYSPRRSGFLVTVTPEKRASQELDAGVEASGPYDLPSASRAVRQRHVSVHRIPTRIRDDRETPLGLGRDGEGYNGDLVVRKIRIFLQRGLDRGVDQLRK
jgi:hypothetical protein